MPEIRTPISCPACGFSEAQLSKSLRLGCPHCYRTFSAQIETILPRLHNGTWHPSIR